MGVVTLTASGCIACDKQISASTLATDIAVTILKIREEAPAQLAALQDVSHLQPKRGGSIARTRQRQQC